MLRAHPDYEQRYRFGSVMIRGHRCIRQVGSGGMCTIYLAESERAGTLVVLKVFNQVPDVSERIVSFDRFLQEYEIVAGLNIRTSCASTISASPTIMPISRWSISRPGDLRQRMKAPLAPPTALNSWSKLPARSRPFIRWGCCTGT